jgi:hypothetical protein
MAQFNKVTQEFLNQEKSLYEVMMLANKDGNPIDQANPLHVSLGTENVTITGTVNVGTDVKVNNTTAQGIPIKNDNGGALSVSVSNFPATQPVSGTFWQTTQPVSGSVSVSNLPATQTVSGSVSVSNFPATQTISGSVNIGTMPEVEIKNDSGNPIPVTGLLSLPAVATDSFGRQRVSSPLTMFDSSHRYSDNGLWETATVTGGSAAFSQNEGLVNLTVTTASGAEVIRETTKVMAYQPGKSLLILNTFVPATPQANLRQRVGYFGAANGMYYEINGTTLAFVERSSVSGSLVETKISRLGGAYGAGDTGWNIDKLDGSGPSGVTISNNKAQILWMDIEWLGLGTVRMGFIIDGKFVHCHSFHHANLITSTYITTGSLPLRYEITNTGTTTGGTLKQICSSVISEGGYELRGLQQAIGIPINSPRTLGTAGTFYPVLSLRLKTSPNRLDSISIATAVSVMPISTGNYNWQLIASGTTTGGTWASAGSNSSVEYNITGTSFSGGRILASGFFSSSNQGVTQVDILKEALFKSQLERNGLTSTPYELTLAVASASSNDTLVASIDWEEISR